MILHRVYPGRDFLSYACFLLSLIVLGVLLFRDQPAAPHATTTWSAFAVVLAVLGAALRIERCVLEVGFHLEEQGRASRSRPS
jgi:hypothetical protein